MKTKASSLALSGAALAACVALPQNADAIVYHGGKSTSPERVYRDVMVDQVTEQAQRQILNVVNEAAFEICGGIDEGSSFQEKYLSSNCYQSIFDLAVDKQLAFDAWNRAGDVVDHCGFATENQFWADVKWRSNDCVDSQDYSCYTAFLEEVDKQAVAYAQVELDDWRYESCPQNGFSGW